MFFAVNLDVLTKSCELDVLLLDLGCLLFNLILEFCVGLFVVGKIIIGLIESGFEVFDLCNQRCPYVLKSWSRGFASVHFSDGVVCGVWYLLLARLHELQGLVIMVKGLIVEF